MLYSIFLKHIFNIMKKTIKKCIKWYLSKVSESYVMLPTGMLPYDKRL